MQNVVAINFRDYVRLSEGHELITDSLTVARFFNKRHSHVVEKVKRLDCSDQFLTSNFSEVTFIHKGNDYSAYEMTKDGFMFLVMGFTGKKAAQIKESYINAFNAMHAFIQSQRGLLQLLAENAEIEKESKKRASAGSRLMLVRKREKPVILQQRLTLERQLQPTLFIH